MNKLDIPEEEEEKPIGKRKGNQVIRLTVKIRGKQNSVTVRKEFVALWLVMSGKFEDDDPIGLLEEFVNHTVLPKWRKKYASGLSEFINHHLLRAFLEDTDFYIWRKLYRRL